MVLGSAGFIGRWVASQLSRAEADLLLPVRDTNAAKDVFQRFEITGAAEKADLADFNELNRLINSFQPAIIFNLAGYGVDRTETDERTASEINCELVSAICRAAARTRNEQSWNGQRIVHAGTAMEYGRADGDLAESSQCLPTTVYGRSKLAGTRVLSELCEQFEIPGTTARLFAVYGPGEPRSRLLPSLISASKTNGPINLTDGKHKRDFTYVRDVANALLHIGSSAKAGRIINVATGKLTSIEEFVRTAAKILGIAEERLLFGSLHTRPEEMRHLPVSTQQLLSDIGWKPRISIEQGISETADFNSNGENQSSVKRMNKVHRVCELFSPILATIK